MKKILIAITFALTYTLALQSQTLPSIGGSNEASKSFKRLSISASYGTMLFYGDVKQYTFFPMGNYAKDAVSEINSGLGFSVNKQISPIFKIQGQLLFGKLSGFIRDNNEYFQTSTTSYSINTVINFNNILLGKEDYNKSYFYGTVGVGLVDFRSVRRVLGTDSPSENDKVIQYYGYKNNDAKDFDKSTTELMIPIGLGFNYPVNQILDIYIETTSRIVDTDKLDAKIRSGNKDFFGYTCIGMTFHL